MLRSGGGAWCSARAANRSLAKVDRPYVCGERSKRPDIALAVTGLRIVTYNLCEGGQDRVSEIAALLRRQHADVIALVEASSRANVDTLGHELTMQVVYGDANSPASVAWLSRLPIRSSSNHRLPELAKTLLEVEVMWAAAPVRLFVTHLADRREEVAYLMRRRFRQFSTFFAPIALSPSCSWAISTQLRMAIRLATQLLES